MIHAIKKISFLLKHQQRAIPKKKSQEHFKPIVQCALAQHFEIRVKSEVCLLIFFSHFRVAPTWNLDGTHEINERNPSKSFKFPSSASLHKVLERFPTMPRGCFKILLLGARESWYFWHSPWSGWRAEIWKIFDFKIKYFSCLCQLSSAPQHFRLSHLERNNKSLSKVIFSDPSVASYKFSSLSRLSSPPIANNNSLN